jgi:tetratricopeptide (TPR) repeat protein
MAEMTEMTSGSEPESPDDFWDSVQRLTSSGRIVDAIALLEEGFPGAGRIRAPRIASWLGQLHHENNSPDEAMSWYRKAIASKDPDIAGEAAFALGNLLEEAGALADAESAYAEAMRFRGDGPAAAGLALAAILITRDRPDEARAALRFAATSDSWPIATTALLQLVGFLQESGNSWGAELLLERLREDLTRAVSDSDAEMAALAHLQLGNVLSELGEVQEAAKSYRSAYDSQIAAVWPQAAAILAVLASSADTSESSKILQVLADHAEDRWIAWAEDQIQSREEI